MALNPNAVGKTSGERLHEYRWQDAALYALGVGAKVRELDFIYEARGPKVLPTYAVVPTYFTLLDMLPLVGGNPLGIVHGGQSIRMFKPFAPSDKLTTVGKVAGVWDMKRMAVADFKTQTRDSSGDLVCETEWSIIFRFDGGFEGQPPPKTERFSVPERPSDFRVEEAISPEQAALYRLNGDHNPLHIDPQVAEAAGFPRPILHGLCTYGLVGRAVLNAACGGDPARLKALSGQFRKPVFPGETLVTEGWRDGNRVILRASPLERPDDHVFSNAYADIS